MLEIDGKIKRPKGRNKNWTLEKAHETKDWLIGQNPNFKYKVKILRQNFY